MKELQINFTEKSQSIPEEMWYQVYDDTYNGMIISTNEEDLPVPWDANFDVEQAKDEDGTAYRGLMVLSIYGGLGPGGYPLGSVVVRVALERLSVNLYHIIVGVDDRKQPIESFLAKWKPRFEELGYKFKEPLG